MQKLVDYALENNIVLHDNDTYQDVVQKLKAGLNLPVDDFPLIREYLQKENFLTSLLASKDFDCPESFLQEIVSWDSPNPIPKFITNVYLDRKSTNNSLLGAKQVIYLDLSSNSHGSYSDRITSDILREVPNLEHFITGTSFYIDEENIKFLPKLKTLEIDFLYSNDISYLAHIPNLIFSEGNINDTQLQDLEGIISLDVGRSLDITDGGLSYLRGICEFKINVNQMITNRGIGYLQGIETLSLNNCDNIDDEALKYLKTVKELDISGCKSISGVGFKWLENVRKLDISTLKVTDEYLMSLKNVRNLRICSCKFITSKGLESFHHLTSLSVGQTELTDDAFYHMKGLTSLNISYTKLGNECLKGLSNLRKLEAVDTKVTEKGLKYVPLLEELIVNWDQITGKTMREMKNLEVVKFERGHYEN